MNEPRCGGHVKKKKKTKKRSRVAKERARGRVKNGTSCGKRSKRYAAAPRERSVGTRIKFSFLGKTSLGNIHITQSHVRLFREPVGFFFYFIFILSFSSILHHGRPIALRWCDIFNGRLFSADRVHRGDLNGNRIITKWRDLNCLAEDNVRNFQVKLFDMFVLVIWCKKIIIQTYNWFN